MKLNVPDLTLAKLSQSERHENGSQKVPCSILAEGNFLLNLFCYLLTNTKTPTLLCLLRKKTRVCSIFCQICFARNIAI